MALILIVDDDFDVRDSLKDVLTDEGFDVAMATDGFEAIRYLRAHDPPALILLDWMMPRCDGARFREMQLADPALARIPVVVLTADARIERESAAFDERLGKPIVLDRLLETVHRHASP